MDEKTNEDELREASLDKLLEETTEHVEFNLDERDKVLQDFKRHGAHNWTQRGIEVFCTICPNHHGFYVPPNIILKGIDANGEPILDKLPF